MNLRHLVLLIAALAVPEASAQASYGARLGLLVTDATLTTGDPEFGQVFAPAASVFAELPISPIASLALDIGYAQAGWTSKILTTSPELPEVNEAEYFEATVRAHYVSFAPAATARLPGASPTPYLFAGPRLDVKVSEQTLIDGQRGAGAGYEDVALGGAIGAGVAIPAGRAEVRADVRVSLVRAGDYLRQRTAELRLGLAF